MSFLNQLKVWKMDTHSLLVTVLKKKQCLTPLDYHFVFFVLLVPGVLERTHILDVDNRFYPIHVKIAHLSEVKRFSSHGFIHSLVQRVSDFLKTILHLCLKFCLLFQVDMPVKTTLDLNMFPNQEPVMKLLGYYDFNVTELKSGHLQLKGSFLKLKLIRNELIRFRGHEHQSHGRTPSAPHNMDRHSSDPRFVSMSVSGNLEKKDAVSQHQFFDNAPSLSSLYRDLASGGSPKSFRSSHTSYADRNASSPVNGVGQKYQWQDGHELRPPRQSPLAYGASSLSTDSPSSLTLLHHTSSVYRDSAFASTKGAYGSQYSIGSTASTVTSRQQDTSYRDSASGGSLRRRPSFNDNSSTSSPSHSSPSHSSPSSSSEGTASFPVDTDSFNFIQTQQRDVVKKIKEHFGTKMEWEEDAGVTMVTFLGKDSKKAKAYLLDVIEKLSLSLRTQVINLRQYDHAKQKQILERIQHNKDSGVMITHSDDVVKLVGSSVESFEVRQKILGHSDDPHRGRDIERNSKPGRSMSVPRQCKLAEHACATDHENKASVQANRYSPLHYQGGSDEEKAQPIGRDLEMTSSKNLQWTSRSSESRDKHRTCREQSIHQDAELASSSQGKWFPAQKFTDAQKFSELNSTLTKNFKTEFKFGRKNK